VASGQIYNIGNPANNHSVRDLAERMLRMAASIPEYAETAHKVQLVETSSGAYYGAGYQDVPNRVPKITNTMRDLDWAPRTDMDTALRKIFEAYRGQIAQARALVDEAGN
jgi:nucleoside-diphosphate-sugar epimerase